MQENIDKLAEVVIALEDLDMEEVKVEVDGKTYGVDLLDYQDFEIFCTETIEEFIRRTQPKDDVELARLIALYLNEVLKNSRK